MTAGYSGTPPAKKLSLKDGMRVWRDGMPEVVADEIASEGLTLDFLGTLKSDQCRPHLRDGTVKAGAPTRPASAAARSIRLHLGQLAEKGVEGPPGINEDTIREVCLPMGLVDVKVCAVDETWSGLKLIKRK